MTSVGVPSAIVFVLAGLACNAIYLTWRNLRGLALRCEGAAPVFAGETAPFRVFLGPSDRDRPSLQLALEDNPACLVDLDAGQRTVVTLPVEVGVSRLSKASCPFCSVEVIPTFTPPPRSSLPALSIR